MKESEEKGGQRPAISLFVTDPLRSFVERLNAASLLRSSSYKDIGDGHPVLVIPGFMGNDQSTELTRKFLAHMGYVPLKWGLGRNLADFTIYLKLLDKIQEISIREGTTISLVGWSMGGIYARLIAHRNPSLIRQVITLGSPFRWSNEPTNASFLYDFVNKIKNNPAPSQEILKLMAEPPPVPATSIYSKVDGVVPWNICIEQMESDWHQNIEVVSSHLGLPNNKSVLQIIADRLQYEKDNWIPFPKNKIIT